MSKLDELIRRATRGEPAPLGFGAGSRKTTPTMLLVALVGEHWARGVAEAVAAGADALVLAGRPSEKELAEAVSAAQGRPCGLLEPEAHAGQPAQLRSAGLDFLVLGPQAPASALLDEELTFLFRLREELTDAQLRTLEALPVDALYLEREAGPATIWRQMELQRISGLARKPLLLQVRPDADQPELLSLREAGAVLIALDLKERSTTDALRRLRGVIDALPRRRPRRRKEGEVTLPGATAGKEEELEEEEEGEFSLNQRTVEP